MISPASNIIQLDLISDLMLRAKNAPELSTKFQKTHFSSLKTAFLIRAVENALLDLFSQGKMNGTIHTCVGQELTGVAINNTLIEGDWVTSNHRCHGHFIAKTGRWAALIDELLGLKSGVCGGIGSSQHLFDKGFISNGTQGSLLPVASGICYSFEKEKKNGVCVSFIGEGTLGEGNVYEAMNLSAVMGLPHVIVCENNFYSQSTPQGESFRGSIQGRAEAFGWKFYEADTWDAEKLFETCSTAVKFARENKTPVFINIHTYRLNAHSKGDDDRDKKEIDFFHKNDLLNKLSKQKKYKEVFIEINRDIKYHIDKAIKQEERFSFEDYIGDQLPRAISVKTARLDNPKIKLIKALRDVFELELKDGAYIVGEDIHDPYGGAFKVTLGLDEKNPGQVISTPISESAITGFGIGMSMAGHKTFVEIMFGDFIVNAVDQIVNNASKFFHMYAKQQSTNVTIRTPMGGGRGYGPTHSQNLEKICLGIDNVAVFALTSLIHPAALFQYIRKLECPSILIESKVDYGATLYQVQSSNALEINVIGGPSGTVVLKPWAQPVDIEVVIITYGVLGRMVADNFKEIFEKSDTLFELFVVQQLNPLPIAHFERSISSARKVLIIEEGSANFGWGSELAYQIKECLPETKVKRIGAHPVPIPSIRELEENILVNKGDIINALLEFGELV
jgi:2-oxoisovalerate dehydrogenase E1 component